jgi:cytochrome P450
LAGAVLYCLATHPDIQQRLYQEIKDVIPCWENFSYEDLKKLKYLDNVLSETLRMYPPAAYIIPRIAKF